MISEAVTQVTIDMNFWPRWRVEECWQRVAETARVTVLYDFECHLMDR